MRRIVIATLLLLALPAQAIHVQDGLGWACGGGGGGRSGHPDACGIDPIGGVGVGADADPRWGASWIDGDERIIGVEIGGDARAVPIKMLDRHEIVNDVIGGIPVAITYCPLCGSGVSFERTLRLESGTVTTDFAASGFLFQHDLVMWDRETGTLWNQILGEPIGTLRDRHADEDHIDHTLVTVPTVLATWDDWRQAHPGSTMLQRPDGFHYGGAYGGYSGSCRLGISGQSQCDLDGLHPKAEVMGVASPRGPVAFAVTHVQNAGGIAFHEGTGVVASLRPGEVGAFDAGRHVFTASGDGWVDETGASWDLHTGQRQDGEASLLRLETAQMYWFAWKEHHPTTARWGSDAPLRAEDLGVGADLEDNGQLPGFTIGVVTLLLVAGAMWLRRTRA